MKTTLEINDALYHKAWILSATTGRTMEELVSDGLRYVLNSSPQESSGPGDVEALFTLRQWFKASDKAMKEAPPEPGARELREVDRRRLETS